MGKNIVVIVSLVIILIGFMGKPSFAAETCEKPEIEGTQTKKSETFQLGEDLNFWGGVNLCLCSILYEAGKSPYNVPLVMNVKAGMSVDMETVFWSLLLSTAKPHDETYGNTSSVYAPFYFLSDFNAYVRHAYAVWRYDDKMYFALGRFDKTIDGKKDFRVGNSSLTFYSAFSYDGLGLFTNLYEEKDVKINSTFLLSYLSKFLFLSSTEQDDVYSHFLLLGIQQQLYMKWSDMALTSWLGFWTITHPTQLSNLSPSTTQYGENAIDGNKDAYLMLIEAYAKITMGSMYAWMHIGYNIGAEEQNKGFIFGLYNGIVDKAGDIGYGVNIFYIDKYMWFDYFVDGTMGAGQRGLQLLFDYCIHKNMFFYAVLTFKNVIGSGSADGQAYFKFGVNVCWSTLIGK